MTLSQKRLEQPRSPEWWARRLSAKIIERRPHYKKLDAYRSGKGGLPVLPVALRESEHKYEWMRKNSIVNYGLLISDAVANRIKVVGFSSPYELISRDVQDRVWSAWRNARMQAVLADALSDMFTFGKGYIFVGPDSRGNTVATSESPLEFYADTDPVNPDNVVAAGKFVFDEIDNKIRFYVYVDDAVYVFEKEVKDRPTSAFWSDYYYSEQDDAHSGWIEWDDDFTVVNEDWSLNRALTVTEGAFNEPPVVVLNNKNSKGEYEDHLNLINRIQQQTFSRTLITETGAWRKMVVLQDTVENRMGEIDPGLPQFDEDGNEIDYRNIVPSSPGEVSVMPPGSRIWESSQNSVDDIQRSIDSDIIQLSAVTNTLVNYLLPSSANQSASASEVSVSTFTSKVEERADRIRPALERVLSLILSADDDLVEVIKLDLSVVYDNFKDASLSDAANADAQAESLPLETRQKLIWGMTDTQIAEARRQREAEEQRQLALELQRLGIQAEMQRLTAEPPPPSESE